MAESHSTLNKEQVVIFINAYSWSFEQFLNTQNFSKITQHKISRTYFQWDLRCFTVTDGEKNTNLTAYFRNVAKAPNAQVAYTFSVGSSSCSRCAAGRQHKEPDQFIQFLTSWSCKIRFEYVRPSTHRSCVLWLTIKCAQFRYHILLQLE